jgi:hypothetical protein
MIRSTAQVAHCFLLRNDKESIRKPVASRQLPTSGHVGVLGNQRQRAHVSTPRPVPATNPARAWSSGPTRPPPHRPGRPRRRQPTTRLHVADRATSPWLDRSAATAFVRFLPHLHFLLLVKRALHAPAIPFPSCPLPTSKSKRPRRRSTRTGRHTDRNRTAAAAAFKSRGGLPCRRSPQPSTAAVHRDLAFVAPCRAGGRAWALGALARAYCRP